MQSHENHDFSIGEAFERSVLLSMKFEVFFSLEKEWGRYPQNPCAKSWKRLLSLGQAFARSVRVAMDFFLFLFAVGGMEKTCLKSKCSAIETFTFHWLWKCIFWRKGDGE